MIAFDIWLTSRTFRSNRCLSLNKERSFVVHYLCGWGIPPIVVGLYIGLDVMEFDSIFRADVFNHRCWDKDKYVFLSYIVIPTAFFILLTVAFMIIAFINMRRQGILPQVLQLQLRMCIRLLLAISLSWIIGFYSVCAHQNIIKQIFAFLISLQGLFSLSVYCAC